MDITRVPSKRAWSPLTRELDKATSPVTLLFKQRYPNVKAIQKRYRESVGPLILGTNRAHTGTLGTAFDWAVRFMLHPQPRPSLALSGARWLPHLESATIDVIRRLGIASSPDGGLGQATFDGPAAGTIVDRELLLRGCWVLALLTEVSRAGLRSGSPLAQFGHLEEPDADELIALATLEDLAELGELCDLAADRLLPSLFERRGQWALGPTFDGSVLMNADADFIAAGLLVELKTTLGDKRSDGTRRAGLDGPTLYQMIGYALLDFSDQFALDTVGLYSARYGHLALWSLHELLSELAGRNVDLATDRHVLRTVLQRQLAQQSRDLLIPSRDRWQTPEDPARGWPSQHRPKYRTWPAEHPFCGPFVLPANRRRTTCTRSRSAFRAPITLPRNGSPMAEPQKPVPRKRPTKSRTTPVVLRPAQTVPISDEDYQQAVSALAAMIAAWWRDQPHDTA